MSRSVHLPLLLGLLLGSGFAVSGVAAKEVGSPQQSLRRSQEQVANWLERHRDRPPVIRAFVQRMPKGGDIHTHLSGAVYAEHYLEWAAADGYCVDSGAGSTTGVGVGTVKLVPPQDCGKVATYFPATQLFKQTKIYDALINQWSLRNLAFAGKPGHDQFFQAFEGFDLISSAPTRRGDMVAEVANRAASQYISYLELLLTTQGSPTRQLAQSINPPSLKSNADFAEMRRQLLDKGLLTLVANGRKELDQIEQQTVAALGCQTTKSQPGCRVTIRFLQQTTRTKPPAEVFAQFVYAFELAKADPRVVGINLVAPEDHPIALRDYTLQMEMIKFLRSQIPGVKVSLHAGELTLGLVPPDDLRFHIRQAVEIAQANRIGHGVGIFYEDDAFALMESMRQRGVLVEICLTSNETILNVQGQNHPFATYRAAGVPMTLASDDEGIARIDLSHEYHLAVLRHGMKYQDLKQLARNSLEYSFAAGASLWRSPQFTGMVAACESDTPGSGTLSKDCSAFLKGSDRARLQWQLEADFANFEALPWLQQGNDKLGARS
ncbi:MAG: adenosine deaminase [Leptolyngbyaceae cyanobacterium]